MHGLSSNAEAAFLLKRDGCDTDALFELLGGRSGCARITPVALSFVRFRRGRRNGWSN